MTSDPRLAKVFKTLMVVSGGDAPGINAVLMRYTELSEASGCQVVGAMGGFAGALDNKIVSLSSPMLAPLAGSAGSFLPSSREPVLRTDDGRSQLRAIIDQHHISSIVLLGGNGSLGTLLPILKALGVPCIGLPNTIDNDVPGTERTLGFDSACNFAYPLANGIGQTARALPGRIFTLETLGGDSGMLALDIALGVSADCVLLKEYDYDVKWLGLRLQNAVARQGYALAVHSEGARDSRTLPDIIYKSTGIRVRDTRLGHAQRGATPTHVDRLLAVQMAKFAFGALRDGVKVGTVVVGNGRIQLRVGTLEGLPTPMPDRTLYDSINGFAS